MSTIITTIGAAVLGLIGLAVVVLWRRTHRELRDLRRELRATQQELEIQRIVVDKPEGPSQRRRHLRALAFLAPVLLWLREHRGAAVSTAAVGTVAAVAILIQAGAPSQPRQRPHAEPAEPLTPPPNSSANVSSSSASTASAPVPTQDQTATALPSGAPAGAPDEATRTDSTPPSPPPGTSTPPASTASSAPSPSNPGQAPQPEESPLLCVDVDLSPLTVFDVCVLGTQLIGLDNPNR